ncbi:GNAT family N-acetyltransferase [Erwinia papayae]|uniref:GNAT family N-acetyltransferase n=1 Tax=Erwinia papayae TaxID=206499 RepID=A0ABV3N1V3_9GAMM
METSPMSCEHYPVTADSFPEENIIIYLPDPEDKACLHDIATRLAIESTLEADMLSRPISHFVGCILSGRLLVAYSADRLVGAVSLIRLSANYAEISSAWIDREYRGKGIYSRLKSTMLTMAKQLGLQVVSSTKIKKDQTSKSLKSGIKFNMLPVSYSYLRGRDSQAFATCCRCGANKNAQSCAERDVTCLLSIEVNNPEEIISSSVFYKNNLSRNIHLNEVIKSEILTKTRNYTSVLTGGNMFTDHGYSKSEIAGFKNELAEKGYLFIQDLPDGFDHLYFSQEFGKLLPQYDGNLVWSIRPKPEFDNHYHSLNTKKLSPHTECYEYPGLPPKYLSLWCVTPSECGGGQTTLLDVLSFFEELSTEEKKVLTEEQINFVSSSGIQSSALGKKALHPIVSEQSEGKNPLIRFSRNCVENCSPDVEKIGDKLVAKFEKEHLSIDWKKNSFLIWDNQRLVHSRTAFEDRNRELKRVWLTN